MKEKRKRVNERKEGERMKRGGWWEWERERAGRFMRNGSIIFEVFQRNEKKIADNFYDWIDC